MDGWMDDGWSEENKGGEWGSVSTRVAELMCC